MSRHVHLAKREDDKRLRPGGRKEPVNARMSPATISRAKELATARGESLGKYLERLVLADLGDKMTLPGDG